MLPACHNSTERLQHTPLDSCLRPPHIQTAWAKHSAFFYSSFTLVSPCPAAPNPAPRLLPHSSSQAQPPCLHTCTASSHTPAHAHHAALMYRLGCAHHLPVATCQSKPRPRSKCSAIHTASLCHRAIQYTATCPALRPKPTPIPRCNGCCPHTIKPRMALHFYRCSSSCCCCTIPSLTHHSAATLAPATCAASRSAALLLPLLLPVMEWHRQRVSGREPSYVDFATSVFRVTP